MVIKNKCSSQDFIIVFLGSSNYALKLKGLISDAKSRHSTFIYLIGVRVCGAGWVWILPDPDFEHKDSNAHGGRPAFPSTPSLFQSQTADSSRLTSPLRGDPICSTSPRLPFSNVSLGTEPASCRGSRCWPLERTGGPGGVEGGLE